MDTINCLPIIKKVMSKTIGIDLISTKPMNPPTGQMPYMTFYVGEPSGYRSGTFFTCVATGDVFMHDGWKNNDGLGVVMMWRKDEFKKPDSSVHRIEWSTGHNDFMYNGEVRMSTVPEIESFIGDLMKEGDNKIFHKQ